MYKTLWKEVMTEELRRIEYRFLHWGPFVCHYTLTPEEVESFRKLQSGKDYRDHLAGHLENEKALDKKEVYKLLFPYLNSYAQGYQQYRAAPLCNGFEMITSWVNRQTKNEFNPPHTHDGHLSFVLYTEVPQALHKECFSSVSNSPGPGCITFDFNLAGSNMNKFFLQTHSHLPAVGDLFIFPAALPHWVYPFKTTEGERVSISGNIHLIDGDKTLTPKHDSKEK
tara:strand:- start:2790 stop:3464 length:675 start_codon:yes stop_codon:yes gene_type:complete